MYPKPSEVWDQGDDWSGIIDSKERRRRQNRLHQRAYSECYPAVVPVASGFEEILLTS